MKQLDLFQLYNFLQVFFPLEDVMYSERMSNIHFKEKHNLQIENVF